MNGLDWTKTFLFQVDKLGTQVLVRDDKGTELPLLPFSLQAYLLIIFSVFKEVKEKNRLACAKSLFRVVSTNNNERLAIDLKVTAAFWKGENDENGANSKRRARSGNGNRPASGYLPLVWWRGDPTSSTPHE